MEGNSKEINTSHFLWNIGDACDSNFISTNRETNSEFPSKFVPSARESNHVSLETALYVIHTWKPNLVTGVQGDFRRRDRREPLHRFIPSAKERDGFCNGEEFRSPTGHWQSILVCKVSLSVQPTELTEVAVRWIFLKQQSGLFCGNVYCWKLTSRRQLVQTLKQNYSHKRP